MSLAVTRPNPSERLSSMINSAPRGRRTIRPRHFCFTMCLSMVQAVLLVSLLNCAGQTTIRKAGSSLTPEALENMAYQSEWPKGGVAQLANGEYREKYDEGSASELIIGLTDFNAFGDLNGDGAGDAIVILYANPGGSGTFFYLAAVINQEGDLVNLAGEFLGDRVKVESVSIEEEDIVVHLVTHGPDDALCCPTQPAIWRYALEGNSLVRSSNGK